ncbi:MAG: ATP-binding protein [Nocardioidaceae bacterium]|nr:ATP-binding protein [Nocardioidaceae bacterium]
MSTFVSPSLRGSASMDLPFTPASAGAARRALSTWLHDLGYDDGLVDDAQLVITELVANSVLHAQPLADGSLHVGWQCEGDRLLLTVRDGGGVSVPTQRVAAPEALGGRGLGIVDALGTWTVETESGGSAIHVRMDLPLG